MLGKAIAKDPGRRPGGPPELTTHDKLVRVDCSREITLATFALPNELRSARPPRDGAIPPMQPY